MRPHFSPLIAAWTAADARTIHLQYRHSQSDCDSGVEMSVRGSQRSECTAQTVLSPAHERCAGLGGERRTLLSSVDKDEVGPDNTSCAAGGALQCQQGYVTREA